MAYFATAPILYCIGKIPLQGLLRSLNNIILGFLGQYIEECAVARHPDYEILMPLRMLLGIQQGLPGYDIVLHMISMEPVEECL